MMSVYKDMNTRDLFQRRTTNERGETEWKDSTIIRAAKEGSLLLLDNIQNLSPGSLSVIQVLKHFLVLLDS
jgi:MoxR-like ATPase